MPCPQAAPMSQVSGFTGNHGRVWGRYLADPVSLVWGKKTKGAIRSRSEPCPFAPQGLPCPTAPTPRTPVEATSTSTPWKRSCSLTVSCGHPPQSLCQPFRDTHPQPQNGYFWALFSPLSCGRVGRGRRWQRGEGCRWRCRVLEASSPTGGGTGDTGDAGRQWGLGQERHAALKTEAPLCRGGMMWEGRGRLRSPGMGPWCLGLNSGRSP